MEDVRMPQSYRPPWLDEYEIFGKIGEGTYGLVYLAKNKDKSNSSTRTAIKKFKQSKEGDGVSPTAIREIMLLRECNHENIVRLVKVHMNHVDMSLYLAFDYAEHDLYEIIRHHREKVQAPIREYTVKSLLWQIINGLNYLHNNWIIHRDLKPSNILVTGNDGDEAGIVKIADFGLARLFQAPLRPLWDNGVVVTIWYRSPELLLGSKHYTCAVDMWAIGCIFAELLTLKPLFQGSEDKSAPNPFQIDQLDKIFRVLGHPTTEKWSSLSQLPHWQCNRQGIHSRKYDPPPLSAILQQSSKSPAMDLLSQMLEYDPIKRITAAKALEHEYFHMQPLPGKNALAPSQVLSTEKSPIAYPARPVDPSTDFETQTGTTSAPTQQRQGTVITSQGGRVQPSKMIGSQVSHNPTSSNVNPGRSAMNNNNSGSGYSGPNASRVSHQQHQQARMKERSMQPSNYTQPANKSRRI